MEVEGMVRSTAMRDFSAGASSPAGASPKKASVSADGRGAVKALRESPAEESRPSSKGAGYERPAAGSPSVGFGQPATAGNANFSFEQPAAAAKRGESVNAAGKGRTAQAQGEDKAAKTAAQRAAEAAAEGDRVRLERNQVEFGYNDKINRFTITFKSAEDGEVVKEIPPEQTQRMLEKLYTMSGMMMDTEV